MIPKAVSKFMFYVSIWYKKLIQKHFSWIYNQGAQTLFFWYKNSEKDIQKFKDTHFNPHAVEVKFFGVKEFSFKTFDFRNGCKNEFNRYRRGLETCPQAKTSKSGHAILFFFFRRVRAPSMTQRWVENTRFHFWTFSPVSVKSNNDKSWS